MNVKNSVRLTGGGPPVKRLTNETEQMADLFKDDPAHHGLQGGIEVGLGDEHKFISINLSLTQPSRHFSVPATQLPKSQGT